MTTRPDPPEERPSLRERPAFLWTFGLCAGLPLLAGIFAIVNPSGDYGFLVVLLTMPVLWLVALIGGLVARFAFHRADGTDVLLGALVGALVGFSLCSGVLFGVGAL